jgi:hypothetical protein
MIRVSSPGCRLLACLVLAAWAAACRTTATKPDAAEAAAAGSPADGADPGAVELPDDDAFLTADQRAAFAALDELLPSELPDDSQIPGWDAGAAPSPAGWSTDPPAAIRRAQANEQPMIFWFSDPRMPPDRMLAEQALDAPAMRALLADRAVGVRVDTSSEPRKEELRYYASLRERLKPRALPTVLVLLPDGTELTRYVGYKADTAEGWLQRLERDLQRATTGWATHKTGLERQGFRAWTDRAGRTAFARALQRKNSDIQLVDAFGRRYWLPLERFSNDDLSVLLDTFPD